MSDVFYAYIKSDEIIDFARKYYNDIGLVFPSGTVLTRTFLMKKHGYKRIMIDFDQVEGWNMYDLVHFRQSFPRDVPYFTIDYLSEIWPARPQNRGVVILDRMHLILKDWYQSFNWIPLRKVTLTVEYAFPKLDDLTYMDNPFLEVVKLDNTVNSVGCYSFSDCPNLRKVVIGEKAFLNNPLANCSFSNCMNLSTFIILPCTDSQLTCDVYPSQTDKRFMPFQPELAWFKNCPSLSELIIADTTHRIRLDKTVLQ